ncbi:MAG TPA: hypothetical protein VKU00_02910 [Chthonomonadaceae bacterium]|nr:hypothetical protein [Chthonomonadaceae bacterium]
MHVETLLQWHYLIFLLPLAVGALLLLLSSLRMGHHGGHHGVHGGHGPAHAPAAPHVPHGHAVVHAPAHAPATPHGHAPAHSAPTPAHHAPAHTPVKHAPATDAKAQAAKTTDSRPNVSVTTHFVLNLTGANRAPLVMILEAFLVLWGIVGLWADRLMLHSDQPTTRETLAVLGVALVGGAIGARIAAAILARVLPQEETLVVSRNALFGLTGKITYPVSQTSGRIHVYDQHGTLHDEMCRISPEHLPIEKGRRAMVLDMDAKGLLIVEEIPDSTTR